MQSYRSGGLVLFFLSVFCSAGAQSVVTPDSSASHGIVLMQADSSVSIAAAKPDRPRYTALSARSMVLPGLMIAYGATALKTNGLRSVNQEVKEEMWTEHPHILFHLDNYLQYGPAAVVYGLNFAGVKGKHNFFDRSMIYGLSNLILLGTVNTVKKATAQERPDGSAYNSFPSGHTAEAFASAEFLRQEYKDASAWYGIAGYAMAAATGYLRMYNNKHWLSDVVAGAGVGIASTKIAYWLYPKIRHVFSRNKPLHTMIMPTYQSGSIGIGITHAF